MSVRWARQASESDDAYYMRVYQDARHEYPDLTETQLHFGTCVETRLSCLHPFRLRVHFGWRGQELLTDFIASEPPNYLRDDKDYRERVLARTLCPVCDTPNPSDPVNICERREAQLARILAEVVEDAEAKGEADG